MPTAPHFKYATKLVTSLLVGLLLIGCGAEPGPAESADQAEATSAVTGFDFIRPAGLPAGFDAQGHRGARGLLPENTLPAFEAALDLGATTLELDMHFTADGAVVIWHDPIIDQSKCRLPDGADEAIPNPRNPLRRIFISQQPLDVVQSYQCDQNPDPGRFPDQTARAMPLAGSDYRIITLRDLFDFVTQYAESELKSDAQRANALTIQFNIETKRDPDHPENIDDGFTGGAVGPFEEAILALIAEYGWEERIVIQSFDHRSLRTIREVNASIRLAALTTGGEAKIKVYNGYKFDIWSPNANDVTAERIAEAHELGLQVIPWTVNEPDQMRALIDLGVDGLISDRIDLLLALEPD